MPSITYLLTKLVNVGAFPTSKPTSPSQHSFFLSTLPTIRARLSKGSTAAGLYSAFWASLLEALPSSFTLQSVLTSLFAHISVPDVPLDPSPPSRALVKTEAILLQGIVGRFTDGKQYLFNSVSTAMLARDWSEGHARVYGCWIAGATAGTVDTKGKCSRCHDPHEPHVEYSAISAFLTPALDIWTSPEHIKHSLLGRHRCKRSVVHHSSLPDLPRSDIVTFERDLVPAKFFCYSAGFVALWPIYPEYWNIHWASGPLRSSLRHARSRRGRASHRQRT
jgi:telomere length regulation protein